MRRIITLAVAGALALAPFAPAAASSHVITENGHAYTIGQPFTRDGISYVWTQAAGYNHGKPVLRLAPDTFTDLQVCTNDANDTCMRDQNGGGTSGNPVIGGSFISGGCGTSDCIDAIDQNVTYQGHEVYMLIFADHNQGVQIGINDACTLMDLRNLEANNTAWALTAQFRWINRGCTQGNNGNDIDAATDEIDGHQMQGAHYPGTSLTTVMTPQ